MKKISTTLLTSLLLVISLISAAQVSADSVKKEISLTLDRFNASTRDGDADELMTLFDDYDSVMFVGSDSSEIWKGKKQIKEHLDSIFPKRKFFFEMQRTDLDIHDGTTWVFVNGFIDVMNEKYELFRFPYRFTMVLVKKDKDWKIRYFCGSIPGRG